MTGSKTFSNTNAPSIVFKKETCVQFYYIVCPGDDENSPSKLKLALSEAERSVLILAEQAEHEPEMPLGQFNLLTQNIFMLII